MKDIRTSKKNSIEVEIQKDYSFSSYEEVIQENGEYEYSRKLEKILPPGKVDLENLPIQKSGKFYFFQNVVFDTTILDSSKEMFLRHLALIPNPKILFYGNLIEELDSVNVKNSSYTDYQRQYAKSLLKFVGEDTNQKLTRVDTNVINTPKELVRYAQRNNAIVITSNIIVIAYCKLLNVKYRILEKFIESPFDESKEFKCGIDASIISLSIEELKEKFKNFNGILICDVTLIELEKVFRGNFTTEDKASAEFILQSIVYFGDIKYAYQRLDKADLSIVNFYYKNPVGLVLTGDSGFSAYSRRANIPYALFLNKNSSSSEFTSFFNSQYDFDDYIDNDKFSFKSEVLSIKPNYIEVSTLSFLYKRVLIQVFSPSENLKEYSDGRVRIYQNDIVVLRTMELITIIVFSNPMECRGKVWYTGLIENLPKKYKRFLV